MIDFVDVTDGFVARHTGIVSFAKPSWKRDSGIMLTFFKKLGLRFFSSDLKESRSNEILPWQSKPPEKRCSYKSSESIRVCRRLIILRELANEQKSNVFPRSPRASSSHGFDLRA